MKKIVFLALIIIPFILKAQQFEFNFLTKYKITHDTNERENVIYSNSKDETYFLYIYKFNKKTKASLYDIKNLMVYYFKVKETKLNNEVFFEFEYRDSRKIKSDKSKFKNFECEFKTINTDSIKQETTLHIYEKSEIKKTALHIKCTTIKKTENLFHAYKFSCLHPFEFVNMIPDGNYLVEYAKVEDATNRKIEHKLIELKEVNFKIAIQ